VLVIGIDKKNLFFYEYRLNFKIYYMKPLFTIAAISDIHVDKYSLRKDFFDRVNDVADLLLIGGDMNNGEEKDVRTFLQLLSGVQIPIVITFGNHDCDAGDTEKIRDILLSNVLVQVLDGEYAEYAVNGKIVGIAAAKGYGGGFSPYRVVRRGEDATKAFVDEEDREILKLESALHQMEAATPDFKIALTHWAAFKETIEGEPKELYIVLGSSKLGDAIEKVSVHVALSGHAHHGSRGMKKTHGNISVCNVGYWVNDEKMPLFDFFLDGSVLLRYIESH
jgi:Icc-related predicted phosphoesterase